MSNSSLSTPAALLRTRSFVSSAVRIYGPARITMTRSALVRRPAGGLAKRRTPAEVGHSFQSRDAVESATLGACAGRRDGGAQFARQQQQQRQPSPSLLPAAVATAAANPFCSVQVVADWLARVRITPRAVVFIATAAAIYSLGHGLRTHTAVHRRSTQWRRWMRMIAASFRWTHSPSRLAWSEGWRPPGAQSIHSSSEPGELSQ